MSESLRPASSKQHALLHWLPALLAGVFLLLLLPKIGAGTLWHHDELLTANRSREMLVRGDPFTVTVNFEPSVKKPPLQYWTCAFLLWLLPRRPELALRLPTLLAGACCLLLAAWLARVGFSDEGGTSLAAWSAAALAGCGYLIHFSRVALLDTGAALLLTLTLVGCQQARRDTRWWWFVAGVCILGAWQKAPYGLAAWGIVLAVRFFSGTRQIDSQVTPPRWRGHLPAALTVALLGSLGWWLVQWLHTDHAILYRASREQMRGFLRAHDPADQGFRPWLYWFWMIRDWALVGAVAPVAAIAALWPKWQKKAATCRVELGWLCIVFGVALACLPYRAERYLVVITPLLAILSVDFLRRLSLRLPVKASGWLLPLAVASILPVAVFQYRKPSPATPDLLATARELGHSMHPDEKVFVCTDAEQSFEEDGFLMFYANLQRRMEAVTLLTLWNPTAEAACRIAAFPFSPRSLPIGPSLSADAPKRRGVCNRQQWFFLHGQLSHLRLVAQHGSWVLWAEDGTPPGSLNPN